MEIVLRSGVRNENSRSPRRPFQTSRSPERAGRSRTAAVKVGADHAHRSDGGEEQNARRREERFRRKPSRKDRRHNRRGHPAHEAEPQEHGEEPLRLAQIEKVAREEPELKKDDPLHEEAGDVEDAIREVRKVAAESRRPHEARAKNRENDGEEIRSVQPIDHRNDHQAREDERESAPHVHLRKGIGAEMGDEERGRRDVEEAVCGGDEKMGEAEEKRQPPIGFQDLKASSEFQDPVASPPVGARDSADRPGAVFG